jgi:hypothetical protein
MSDDKIQGSENQADPAPVHREVMQAVGWWEEYKCGCVSETVRYKRQLTGYCAKHGDGRRYAYREIKSA